MRIRFKLRQNLLRAVLKDLRRPHAFAGERVGFFLCRPAQGDNDDLIILAEEFQSIADDDYVRNPRAGATMGSAAIRKALQCSYNRQASMFHVHLHDHRGRPEFSRTDTHESARFVPDFWNVQPGLPHGALVLSTDSACGKCWVPESKKPIEISEFVSVGIPVRWL